MTEQLAFDLTARHACGRSDFWVAPCNQEAIAWIDKYPDWPMHAVLIYGEEGSGKSHLASIFSVHIRKNACPSLRRRSSANYPCCNGHLPCMPA